MIGCLDRETAQTFIDVVHEVRPAILHLWRGLITPVLFGSLNFRFSPVSLWMFPISRHGSGGSV